MTDTTYHDSDALDDLADLAVKARDLADRMRIDKYRLATATGHLASRLSLTAELVERDYNQRTAELVAADVPPHLANNEELVITTDAGRTVHLWLHHCESWTGVDVWTEVPGVDRAPRWGDGRAETEAGARRHAVGLFAMHAGARTELAHALIEPTPATVKWPAATTTTLLWHDEPDA